jgi:O-antigen/teichoic acid export membrane protein
MAVFVTRLLIRELGDEAYGLWAIVFGVVEYYTLLDFGMRAAVVKFVAEYTALQRTRDLTITLNAAFLYYVALAAVLFAVTALLGSTAVRFFVVSPEYHEPFTRMVLIAGAGWAFSVLFSWFGACLEAIQRFDLSYRIMIGVNILRVIGMLTLLGLGFGLVPVITVAVLSQVLQGVLFWFPFRRHFPEFRWTFWDVDRSTLTRMLRFGFQVVPSTVGVVLLLHGPALAIGSVMPAEFAGYYALPRRLIQAVLDLVHRLGAVATSRAAELSAREDRAGLVKLGVQANRYSLVTFVPVAVCLGAYGDALLRVWLTPSYAVMSAPLLPVFLIGALLADASQFSSSSILFGMGRHQRLSWLWFIEGIVSVALVYSGAAAGSLLAAATASTAVTILSRGVIAPLILCRELDYSVRPYFVAIASRPLLVGTVVGVATVALRLWILPGRNFLEIAAGSALSCGLYFVLAGRYCVFPQHQDRVLALARKRAPALEGVLAFWFGDRRSLDLRRGGSGI